MLSPVSLEAPTPPPQPSPSAFAQHSAGASSYSYRQPSRFPYEPPAPAGFKSPELSVYGQRGVLSPPGTRKAFGGTSDWSKPEPASSSPMPSSKLNYEISSSANAAVSKPRPKVADDDLALQRLVQLSYFLSLSTLQAT